MTLDRHQHTGATAQGLTCDALFPAYITKCCHGVLTWPHTAGSAACLVLCLILINGQLAMG